MSRFCCFRLGRSHEHHTENKVTSSSSNSTTKAGKEKSSQRNPKVNYGFSLIKGKSNHPMEDFHVAKFAQMRGEELGLFAIFDGHFGDKVPAYLQNHLLSNIIEEEDFWTNPQSAIIRAYEKTDNMILSQSPVLGDGGSTAVTAILFMNERKLWVANVGDSRAVMAKDGSLIQLTVDHEPNTERGFIESQGGFVSNLPGDVPRVNGQLAMSRAFGDKSLKSLIRSEPDIRAEEITDSHTQILIIASDGIWKVMTNEEAIEIVRKTKDPQEAARQLTTEAVNRNSKDDISCIVVRFRS